MVNKDSWLAKMSRVSAETLCLIRIVCRLR